MIEGVAFCPGCGSNIAAEQAVQVGELSYDPRGLVWWGDVVVSLTAYQHSLLGSLVAARGRFVARHVLAERIGSDVDSNVIEVLACKLRRALRAAGAPATLIPHQVRGRGFRLNMELLQCQ